MRHKIIIKCLLLFILSAMVMAGTSFSLTLDEAVEMAKKTLPAYQAQAVKVRSVEAQYGASLSPYLPKLDVSGLREHRDTRDDEFKVNAYDATVSYLVYDGGRRKANRNIAGLNLNSEREELRKSLLDLEFDVKSRFYTLLAREEILAQRKLQLQDSLKDFEIAQGRNRLGVAKRSDVLQASVRLEQARFDLRQAQGDVKKARSDLNSLLGKDLDASITAEEALPVDGILPAKERLSAAALGRPVVQQAKDAIKIADNTKTLTESQFFPTLSLDASYRKTDTEDALTAIDAEDKTAGLFASWNIFELKKFYERKSSLFEIEVSKDQLSEVERELLLEIQNFYEDLVTDAESLVLARQQLETAEFNYDQALGEYRIGKGDVLSLVAAEKLLADARVQFSTSRLKLALSKAALERAAGIRSLDTMEQVDVPQGGAH